MDINATKLDVDNNKSRKYKLETICKSAVYVKELKSNYDIPKLYHLMS